MNAISTPLIVVPIGSFAVCPHGGQMPTIKPEPKVHASGKVVVTSPLPVSITPSCGFTTGFNPHPCSFVSGVQISSRIFINGTPALLASAPMLCKAADQVPQGTPLFLQVAAKVVGK